MKKLVCILTVLLCLCAFSLPCFAADEADVIFTVKAEQKQDENVVVTVVASENSSLYTTEFCITYAVSDLEIIENSIMPGGAVKDLNPIVTLNRVAEDKIKISYTATEPFNDEGAICRFECRALKSTSSPLFIDVEHAETFDGEHIRSLTAQGKGTRVSITEQPVKLSLVAVFVIIMVVGIIVVFILIKKQKSKK